jgi:2-C-methyl-D-erythritol 4-phosphate cytidylyltransferase / 2-C-methyl-D-erythritol 2,4-cyclodiphosphate synthase
VIGSERVGAILAAGGSGLRAGVAKQWVSLGGETVLRRAARALAASGVVDELVLVVPAGEEERGQADLAGIGIPVRTVAGGLARADSVRAGLDALGPVAVVLVHDAARPFATPALARAVAETALARGAALAALAATDTVKRAEGDRVAETLDRRSVWLAQTPQGFRAPLLRKAFEAAGPSAAEATDECQLVERLGETVALVPGEATNFKITGSGDLARARALVEPAVAMGVGYDVHAFAPGRKLVLGGVEFEGDGLLGHSDADICAHALCDAVLGAAGLGDIGRHFPDTDPQWKGVSSLHLLREVAGKAAAQGWSVGNCDVTLAARRPKIAPRAEEMRALLAEALGVAPGQVNVKATTGEGLGFVGRGEGIAAHAVALLVRR